MINDYLTTILGKSKHPDWIYSRNDKFAFPLFKLIGKCQEEYTFENDDLPEVWVDYLLVEDQESDDREYYVFEDILELETKDNQIKFEITNLTKSILISVNDINSVLTDIFSVKGIVEYSPDHFLDQKNEFLKFDLGDSNYLSEFESSRMVNFQFKKAKQEETKIIIIKQSIIAFSRKARKSRSE